MTCCWPVPNRPSCACRRNRARRSSSMYSGPAYRAPQTRNECPSPPRKEPVVPVRARFLPCSFGPFRTIAGSHWIDSVRQTIAKTQSTLPPPTGLDRAFAHREKSARQPLAAANGRDYLSRLSTPGGKRLLSTLDIIALCRRQPFLAMAFFRWVRAVS